jgi:hypothetical protein
VRYKIIPNRNVDKYNQMTIAVNENNGYCPCMIEQSEDTKCICKEFKEQDYEGKCHCERFEKIIIN